MTTTTAYNTTPAPPQEGNRANQQLIFNYTNPKPLRTQTDADGSIFFNAKDLGEMLELSNYRDFLKHLDEDEQKLVSELSTSDNGVQQKREMVYVSESGMYHLIFLSRKPEAKKFRKWLTAEVLPSIRKTGGYAVANTLKSVRIAELQAFRQFLIDNLMRGDRVRMYKEVGMDKKNPHPFFAPANLPKWHACGLAFNYKAKNRNLD